MYSINTGDHRSGYQVSSLVSQRVSPHIISSSHSTNTWSQTVQECIKLAKQLFSGSLYQITFIIIIINFAIQFGYYGLWLWFPELFNKLEKFHSLHPEESKSVCEVVSIEMKIENATKIDHCTSSIPDQEVFVNSFIISISAAPANIWTIYHMDKLGRKFFLCLSMLLSGCSAFFIYLVNSSSMNLLLSCVFGAVSTMGFNSLDCLGIELFPTHLRSTAMAITLVAARLGAIVGNLVFGYLVESHCATPILMVAGLLIGNLCLMCHVKVLTFLFQVGECWGFCCQTRQRNR